MKAPVWTRCASLECIVALSLSACGNAQPLTPARGAVVRASVTFEGSSRGDAIRLPPSTENLYVANGGGSKGTVAVFKPGSSSPLRTISEGIDYPDWLAFDAKQHLYVANFGNNTVSAYDVDSTVVLRTITKDIVEPGVVAVDPVDGYLYVGSVFGGVTVYQAKTGSYVRTIDAKAAALAVAFDQAGNIYVANYLGSDGSVSVYSPKKNKLLRTITDGTDGAISLAFDSDEHLFVGNSYHSGASSVTEYAKGGSKPIRTIVASLNYPVALACDASRNLFVANENTNTVTVYAPGSTALSRAITSGINVPVSLAFGPSGYLNVANAIGNSVTEYPPGSGKVSRKLTTGIDNPLFVTFGP